MSEKNKKTSEPLSLYQILKTINQIATESKDMAPPDNKKIGLKREEVGERVQDRRIIDGFAVKFSGNIMRLSYNSSQNIQDIGTKEELEEEIATILEKITNFIKKEYKSRLDQTLNLKKLMDSPYIFVAVQGTCETDVRYSGYIDYEIGYKGDKNAQADFEELFGKNIQKNKKVRLNEGIKNLKKLLVEKFK